MRVLGIESTCDETAAAVVERTAGGTGRMRSNVVRAQLKDHAAYGGVVPEIAARAHVEAIEPVVAKALADAGVTLADVDAVAAAAGPGLIGGVIVGLTFAKGLALAAGKPFIAVNHLEAHALTARMTDGVAFPYLLLLVSGGHTQLIAVTDVGKHVKLGTTIDDALGEAFDKAAKLLGLGYPGGPEIEREAQMGDAARFQLPRPMIGRPEPDFSLSGLKTALRVEAEKHQPLSPQDVADLCAAFQAAVGDMVLDRLKVGIRRFREAFGDPSSLVVAGGVAANRPLRRQIQQISAEMGIRLVLPPFELCGDNGAMIAWVGIERLGRGLVDELGFAPRARWPLDEASAAPGAKA